MQHDVVVQLIAPLHAPLRETSGRAAACTRCAMRPVTPGDRAMTQHRRA
jgi:hypothetical protein